MKHYYAFFTEETWQDVIIHYSKTGRFVYALAENAFRMRKNNIHLDDIAYAYITNKKTGNRLGGVFKVESGKLGQTEKVYLDDIYNVNQFLLKSLCLLSNPQEQPSFTQTIGCRGGFAMKLPEHEIANVQQTIGQAVIKKLIGH